MDQVAAQAKARQLVELALRSPSSEEGRTAAIAAWKLVRESGLLLVRSDELVTFVTLPPSSPSPDSSAKKPRRKKKPSEVLGAATEGIVTTINAAGQVVSAVNGFRDVLRGR